MKDEIVAELGLAPGGGAALNKDADRKISELEKDLSDKESPWKAELAKRILTQVREIMRLRTPGTVGVPGLPPLTTPLAPPRLPPAGGSVGQTPVTPSNKRSGHSPGEGTTPMRKRSRDDDVIELDADDGAPHKGSTPVAPVAPSAPASGRASGDTHRGSTRGATPRGSSSAPRRNPPQVSATERDLTIKSEWIDPQGDDAFVDAAARADDLRGDPHYKQDAALAEESQLGSKGDEEDDEDEDHDEDSDGAGHDELPEGVPVGHTWTTHDNWQTRLNSLTTAQKLDLDSEKSILRGSGATPSGFEGDNVLTIAALSRLGDNMPNCKFRMEWAARDEKAREALAGPVGFEGPAAIGFTWLASVHWTESRDPMILPIEVVSEEAYRNGKYAVYLPALELFTSEHREALNKTMAACAWLTGERQRSKLGLSQDTGHISDKELLRDFVTLVYDTPPTKQGFDGISQISQLFLKLWTPPKEVASWRKARRALCCANEKSCLRRSVRSLLKR